MSRRITLVVLVLTVACLFPAASPGQIVAGPIRWNVNGHDYFIARILGAPDYYNRAGSIGGYPVVINDALENAWIAQALTPIVGTQMLIGLSDTGFEGAWQWVNADGVLDSYTNWNTDEPNNAANEDYAVILPGGRWNDLSGAALSDPFNPMYAIIEANPVGSMPTGYTVGPVCDPSNGHTYYITSNSTMRGAEAFAQSLGGHLATVESERENFYLLRNLLTLPIVGQWVNIGLNDTAAEGNFTWASGSGSTFRRWASTEPNNAGNEDIVAVLLDINSPNAGLWFDINDAPRPAVIEVPPATVCPADFNRSGNVSVQDIFDFLAAYFAGCP